MGSKARVLWAVAIVAALTLAASPQVGARSVASGHRNVARPGKRSPQVELVTHSPGGNGANDNSGPEDIAADAHYLYFESTATNLVSGTHDTAGTMDLFERDLATGTTSLVSKTPAGDAAGGVVEGLATDANGRYVAYVDVGCGIAPGPGGVGRRLLLFDRVTGATTTISAHTDGTLTRGKPLLPSVSGNGRYVDYARLTRNGVPSAGYYLYRYDRETGLTTMLVDHSIGAVATRYEDAPATSSDGRYVYYQTRSDFVDGQGRVVFTLYRLDTTTGVSQRIARTHPSFDIGFTWLTASADGNEVAFGTTDHRLVPNDDNQASDIFVWAASTGVFQLVSHAIGGGVANGDSLLGAISSDGIRVCYRSDATDIVPGDTTDDSDVYVHNLEKNVTVLVTRNVSGSQDGTAVSEQCTISRHGGHIAFTALAPDLTSPPSNQKFNVFEYIR